MTVMSSSCKSYVTLELCVTVYIVYMMGLDFIKGYEYFMQAKMQHVLAIIY